MQIYDNKGVIARGIEAIATSEVWKGRPNLWRGKNINRAEIIRILIAQELLKLKININQKSIEIQIEKLQGAIDLCYGDPNFSGSIPRLEKKLAELKADL